MSTDEAIAAAQKLGARVPTNRAMTAGIDSRGHAFCPTCSFGVDRYSSCEYCGQMLEWGWLHGHIEHLIETDKSPETTDPFMAVLSHWPSTLLVRLSFITRRELCAVLLAENNRRHCVEVRRRCAEELDRRSARGIEDD